jgi:hypothetical protein
MVGILVVNVLVVGVAFFVAVSAARFAALLTTVPAVSPPES